MSDSHDSPCDGLISNHMAESADNSAAEEPKLGFVAEFKEFLGVLPQKNVFLVLLGAWVALFWFLGNSTFGYVDTPSLFSWMYTAYNAPGSEDSHGNLIPFVVLGLIWWKRDELKKLELQACPLAFGVIVLGLAFHIVGFIAQQPRISIVGLITGLYGIMGLVWGRQWMRHILFPFFLIVFCIPIGSLANVITFPLRLLVSELAVGVASNVLQLDIVREGTMMFDADRTFQYDVAPACSGIRSLITLFALTTIFGFVSYRSTWRRGVMMLSSLPLAVLGNVLRITTVVVVGDVYGSEKGLLIEQKLGFVTFLVAIVGVMILGHFLNEDRPVENDAHEE